MEREIEAKMSREIANHTMIVERVSYGTGQPNGQPSTVALLHGRRLPHGQPITAAVEPRMARDIESALNEQDVMPLAALEAWQIIPQN